MEQFEKNGDRGKPISWFVWGIVVLWTAVGIVSVLWNLAHTRRETLELARTEARTSYHKDLIYRRWAAGHGGLYIPVTKETEPSPYLSHVKERDIETPSGRALTLVNPAYMIRLIHEMTASDYGIRSHVTSLKPLRPENAPDTWEAEALHAFEAGEAEVSALVTYAGEIHMRLMRPMVAEEKCLKCHTTQGYREGDQIGGIGVSLPFGPYKAAILANTKRIALAHGLIWILGLTGIGMGARRTRRHILDREDAAANLAAKERRFRALIEKSTDLIVLLGEDGVIHWCSPALQMHLGYLDTDLIGRNVLELLHPEDLPSVTALRTQVLGAHGTATEAALRLRHKDKGFRWVEGVVTNLLADPDVEAIVINCRDITERKRLEDQLRQAQKMEAVGQLAGGVAHDFNNLLSPILGYAEILLEDYGENEDFRSSLLEIKNAAERSRDLTRQLLAFSRKQPLDLKAVDIRKVVTGLEKLLRRALRENIALQIKTCASDCTATADSGQLEQVLMNLAVNAQDAMPNGGAVTIETAREELDEARCAAHHGTKPGSYVVLIVSDTGCGMDDETKNHIFEPFFSTKGEGGTGLGLATVYGIVSQHGGSVWIDSEPGRGSIFKIYLPAGERELGTSQCVIPAQEDRRGSEVVLVVEDDPMVRRLACTILRKNGYTVLEAGNGQEALHLLESNMSVRLMLSDVIMPGINGMELFEKTRAKHPDLKVLFMSGHTENVISHSGVLEPELNLIHKPFSVQALTSKVRQVLDHANT
jgi:PAS domain S-box-containing protein